LVPGAGKSAIVNGLPSGPMTYFTLGRWGSVMAYSQLSTTELTEEATPGGLKFA
jgi:hypothetical protein